MRRWTAAGLLAVLAGAGPVHADEAFDASSYDKKTFELTGFLEARPERQWLRQGSAVYLLLYPGQTRDTADRLGAAAEVSGVLRHQALSFNFTGHASWMDEPRGSDEDSRMYEAYGTWQIDERSKVEAGKRTLHWGKGYAWSPVAFLERAKDPTDPELAREGFAMATGSWVRSFDGPLRTLALTAAVVPVTDSVNTDFAGPSTGNHSNPALKLYGLLYDTDIDLIWAARGSRGPRFGVDFSRNLGTNLEIHGEWAHVVDAQRAVLTPANTLQMQTRTYDSALAGLRYLTERDTTYIFELYRNGGGYTTEEMSAFYELVHASAANAGLTQPASRAATQGYNRPNVAQHYAYLRVSQKEPFDILDFTPALTLIANTGDRSYSLIPEVLYAGFKNLELRLRLALNSGSAHTEYGEKPVSARVEFRARYFF